MGKFYMKKTIFRVFLYIFLSLHFLVFANEIDEANLAIENKDYATALVILKQLAKQNHVEAQFKLSEIYRNGLGVKKNNSVGLKYLISAANLGSVQAQFNLAKIYLKGIEKPKNKKEAIRLLELSAENNNILANDLLGEVYNEPITIKGDIKKAIAKYDGNPKKAIEHTKIAAKHNIFQSQIRLAYFYFTQGLIDGGDNHIHSLKWWYIVKNQRPELFFTFQELLLNEMPAEDILKAKELTEICLLTYFKECD